MNLANKITIGRIGLIPLLVLFLQPYPDWLAQQFGVVGLIDRYGIYLATLVFIVTAATDKIDGYIARTYNQITNLGKLLDPLADKLLLLTALIMLVQIGAIPSWAAVAMIGREAAITGFRAVAAAKGNVLAADRYGKWKMVLQVVAIVAVLVERFPIDIVAGYPIGTIAMWAAVVLRSIPVSITFGRTRMFGGNEFLTKENRVAVPKKVKVQWAESSANDLFRLCPNVVSVCAFSREKAENRYLRTRRYGSGGRRT